MLGGSQSSVTPFPGNPISSSGLHRHCTYDKRPQTYKHIHKHKIHLKKMETSLTELLRLNLNSLYEQVGLELVTLASASSQAAGITGLCHQDQLMFLINI